MDNTIPLYVQLHWGIIICFFLLSFRAHLVIIRWFNPVFLATHVSVVAREHNFEWAYDANFDGINTNSCVFHKGQIISINKDFLTDLEYRNLVVSKFELKV